MVVAVALVGTCSGCGQAHSPTRTAEATVGRVADGDTIELAGGTRVRLVQIDAPELGEGECYSRAALDELERLVHGGQQVELESDRRLDDVDRYGRLLRYVLAGATNVSVELVRRGAAMPSFVHGVRGAHADELLAAVAAARSAGRGMWGACRVMWREDRRVDAPFRVGRPSHGGRSPGEPRPSARRLWTSSGRWAGPMTLNCVPVVVDEEGGGQ